MRYVPYALALLVSAAILLSAWPERPAAQQSGAAAGVAIVAEIKGGIGPATARFVDEIVEQAQERQARLIILQMDTPGGLASSMRDIIRSILASPIPVVTFVAPSGARAASAGTYILYASHVAAMAPATNLGAATPVQIGGSSPLPGGGEKQPEEGERDKDGEQQGEQQEGEQQGGDAMSRKAINDAVAYIRSLAELRGRNADWAERAVRQAASLSAQDALEQDVIDLMAGDIAELLKKIDGRTVQIGSSDHVLETDGLAVERIEPDWLTEFLSVITDPNIALILMMIGIYGLIFEFWNPGTIGPGIIGAICLVLGLYALNTLPLDYAGLALVLLGIAFMVAEAFVPSFGILGIGGVVGFALGAMFLIDTETPGFQISLWVVIVTAAVSALFFGLVITFAVRAHRRPAVTGDVEVLGQLATVTQWKRGEGIVRVRGEEWRALGSGRFKVGDRVVVEAMDGLTLTIGKPTDANQNPGDKETNS